MWVAVLLGLGFAIIFAPVFAFVVEGNVHMLDNLSVWAALAVGTIFVCVAGVLWWRNDRYIESKVHKELRHLCRRKDHSWMEFGGFANEDERYKDIAFNENEENLSLSDGYYLVIVKRRCHFCSHSTLKLRRIHDPHRPIFLNV